MWARLYWYAGLVVVAGVVLFVAWRRKAGGLRAFHVLALWSTSLTVGALPNVTRPPASVGIMAIAQAATYIVAGSFLLYGLFVPRTTGLTLRKVGWANIRLRDAGAGIVLGLIVASSLWHAQYHPLVRTSVTGTRLAYLVAVQALGVAWQEEMLFRGFIMEVMKRSDEARTDLAVVCQAILFAAYAPAVGFASWVVLVGLEGFSLTSFGPPAVQAFLDHLLMGLIFGYLRERVHGLLGPWAAHATLNIVVIMSRGY